MLQFSLLFVWFSFSLSYIHIASFSVHIYRCWVRTWWVCCCPASDRSCSLRRCTRTGSNLPGFQPNPGNTRRFVCNFITFITSWVWCSTHLAPTSKWYSEYGCNLRHHDWFVLFSGCCVASLCAGLMGCISYNMYTVNKGPLFILWGALNHKTFDLLTTFCDGDECMITITILQSQLRSQLQLQLYWAGIHPAQSYPTGYPNCHALVSGGQKTRDTKQWLTSETTQNSG